MLIALAPVAAAQQREATSGDTLGDFIGRNLETSILLSAGPGPGDAVFHVGETEVRNTKLLVDVDLPFGMRAGPDEGHIPQDALPGGGTAGAPRVAQRYLLQPVLDFRGGVTSAERPASEAVSDAPNVRVQVDGGTAAAGVGLRIELERWLHLEPRVTFVYGHLKARAEGGDPVVRQRFETVYDEVLVDWRAETLTVMPILALEADVPVGPFVLHGALTGTVLRTFTTSATTPLQRRNRTSLTLRASLAVDIPIPGFTPGGRKVYIMPAIGMTRLEGDLGELPDVGQNFFDVTIGIAPDLRGVLPLVGRLGFSVTHVRGHGLEGYGWDVIWIVDV